MPILTWLGALTAVAAAPPAPPYSLPWQLRPVTVGTSVRSDTSLALYEPGATVASTLGASWAVTPHFAPLIRGALVYDAPSEGPAGAALVNPLVGGTWATGGLRLAGMLGVTLPVGTAGGTEAEAAETAAASRGIAARSGMDNALFAVNYTSLVAGADAAWLVEGASRCSRAGTAERRAPTGKRTPSAASTATIRRP
jgi:hypothetical protein